jgi:uncharacterized hydrophobic protein (TIGR00271 family)
LVIGAARDSILDYAVLGSQPAEIVQARSAPTLWVKSREGTRHFWLRRAWELIYNAVPTLVASERAEVLWQMRTAARANVDYYALILLASAIATLGLLQNSAAVIIGAMLVAPLMSPMMAIAHGLTQGSLRLLRHAVESTVKGIALAVGVSLALSLLLPSARPSAEILARSEPNLLDLLVALASGAAAAYALSRKKVAAALPGVAIAAALVPPLCVVGYGLGISDLGIAGGASLLFTTNLSAIVLAGVVVFLLLGFRPVHARGGAQLRRGIILAGIALLILSVPLGFATMRSARQLARELNVEALLKEMILAEFAEVDDLAVERQGDGFVVSATVYVFNDESMDPERLSAIQQGLSAAAGGPVTIRAKVIRAELTEIEAPPEPAATAEP